MLTAKECLLWIGGYGNGDGNGDGYGYGDYCMPHPYYKVDGIWCKFISIHGNYAKIEIADLYHAENCIAGYIAKDGDGKVMPIKYVS